MKGKLKSVWYLIRSRIYVLVTEKESVMQVSARRGVTQIVMYHYIKVIHEALTNSLKKFEKELDNGGNQSRRAKSPRPKSTKVR